MAATVTLADATFRLQCESQVSGDLVDDIGSVVMVASGSPALETSSPMLGVGSAIGDGTDDLYQAGAVEAATSPGSGSFSVSFLVDLDGNSVNNLFLISTSVSLLALGFSIRGGNGGNMRMLVHNGVDNFPANTSFNMLTNPGPHSVAFAYDVTSATGYKVYIDGALDVTGPDIRSVGDIDSAKPFEIMAISGASFFKGLLDEIVFYKGYVLTADDAVFLHNGGSFLSLGAPAAAGGIVPISHPLPMGYIGPMETS